MSRILIVLIILSLFAPLRSQTDSSEFGFELTGRYFSGSIRGRGWYEDHVFEIQDNYLYVIYGNTLVILNMDNPESFEQLGAVDLPKGEHNETLIHTIQLGVVECTIYSKNYGDLHLSKVDVSNPSQPQITSTVAYENYGWEDCHFDENYVYHGGSNSLTVDSLVSDGSIINIANLAFPDRAEVFDYQDSRTTVYCNGSLYFIDVSDRYNPTIDDSLSIDLNSYNTIDVCGDYLILGRTDGQSEIIDISPGGSYAILCEFPDAHQFYQPIILGDTLYSLLVEDDSISFNVIDMNSPTSPEIISSTYLSDYLYFGGPGGPFGSSMNLMVKENKAVISGGFLGVDELDENSFAIRYIEDGLRYFDLSDVSNPISYQAQRGRAVEMQPSSHGIYLLGHPWTLLDIENPSTPIFQGSISPLPSLTFTDWISIEGNLMVVRSIDEETDEISTIRISAYDLADPLNPDLTGSLTLELVGVSNLRPVMRNSMVYFGSTDSMYTIDFNNPAQPELTSVIYTGGRFRHLENSNSGHLIYGIVDDQYILTIIDVSIPRAPVIVGTFSGDAYDYVIDGDIGFSQRSSDNHDGSMVIKRLDISDPQNVIELGSFNSGSDMWSNEGLLLDGSFLYVYSLGAVEVFDISIVGQETRIARYETSVDWPGMWFSGYGIRDISVDDGTVYLLHELDGLHILNHSTVTLAITEQPILPITAQLNQNYPNPFNPTTTISYELPEETDIALDVYDISSRLVTRLESGLTPAGWHTNVWSGLDDKGRPVSTGIYLAKLQAGSYTRTIKMLYLK